MRSSLLIIREITLKLLLLVGVYTLCRLVFYFYNASHFDSVSLLTFIHGIRFDLVAIAWINWIYVFLKTLPLSFVSNFKYQRVLEGYFVGANSLAILFNFIDMEYFNFTFKRSTADLFSLITYGEDIWNLIPAFLKDYWWILLLFGAVVYGFYFLNKKIINARLRETPTSLFLVYHLGIFALMMGVMILMTRGGVQYRPLSINHAGYYTSANNIPLVLNTPFSIIRTIGKTGVDPVDFFDEETREQHFSTHRHYTPPQDASQPNVVLIVLESFSKEHIGAYNPKANYTPFLDSLLGQSLHFRYSFANGKKSIDGIPAIVAGIPTLMDVPFISSAYAGNQVRSLPLLLSEMGYSTSFYHGGINGTMGFDGFAKSIGFDRYSGMNEYPEKSDFDETWGVYDEPYLQFYAHELDRESQPFFSTVFTLTSHHPYAIPEAYQDRFPEGKHPIHQAMAYTDYALQQFFNTAAQMDWFDNTLFVITSDHTSVPQHIFYKKSVGMYAVPIAFFGTGISPNFDSDKLVQHIDIFPSIMDHVGYEEPFRALGTSMLREGENRLVMNYINGIYQLVDRDLMIKFDGEDVVAAYYFREDSLLKKDVSQQIDVSDREEKVKAVIQVFNNSLIENKIWK